MSHKSLLSLSLSLLIAISCSGTDSYQYLNGEFIASTGQNPAILMSPPNNGTAVVTDQFTWSKQDGVKSYKIEFSTSTDFTAPVLSATLKTSSYTIKTEDLIGVTSLALKTFYWRVSTNYATKTEISSTSKCDLMSPDTVYVNISSTAGGQVGNQSVPYKNLQQAIEFALSSGRSKVYVADGLYSETIIMREGVSLYGGYAASTWIRNLQTNTSTIKEPINSYTVVFPGSITNATVLDGFTIQNFNTLSDAVGIYIVASSPILTNLYISTNANTGAFDTYGIKTQGSCTSLKIFNSIIRPQTGTNTYGVYLSMGSAGSTNIDVVIANNTITGGTATNNAAAIHLLGSSTTGTHSLAILNNILYTEGGTNRYCVNESTTQNVATNVSNNNFFQCATAAYRDNNGAGTYTTVCSDGRFNTACGAGVSVATTTSGNISVTNAGPLFTNISSDWTLGTVAANCNVRAGGLNLASTYSYLATDRFGTTRTTTLPATNGTCGAPNTGAAGWSMGAYESDN